MSSLRANSHKEAQSAAVGMILLLTSLVAIGPLHRLSERPLHTLSTKLEETSAEIERVKAAMILLDENDQESERQGTRDIEARLKAVREYAALADRANALRARLEQESAQLAEDVVVGMFAHLGWWVAIFCIPVGVCMALPGLWRWFRASRKWVGVIVQHVCLATRNTALFFATVILCISLDVAGMVSALSEETSGERGPFIFTCFIPLVLLSLFPKSLSICFDDMTSDIEEFMTREFVESAKLVVFFAVFLALLANLCQSRSQALQVAGYTLTVAGLVGTCISGLHAKWQERVDHASFSLIDKLRQYTRVRFHAVVYRGVVAVSRLYLLCFVLLCLAPFVVIVLRRSPSLSESIELWVPVGGMALLYVIVLPQVILLGYCSVLPAVQLREDRFPVFAACAWIVAGYGAARLFEGVFLLVSPPGSEIPYLLYALPLLIPWVIIASDVFVRSLAVPLDVLHASLERGGKKVALTISTITTILGALLVAYTWLF